MSVPETTRIRVAAADAPARLVGGAHPEEVSALGLANVILRHRTLVAALALIAAVATALFVLTTKREYVSAATFVPQIRAAATMSGIAAQLGLSMPGGDPAQSPQFYVDLAQSREILGRIAAMRFTYPTDSGQVSATPVQIYAAREKRISYRREVAIDELRKRIKTRVTSATGVVELTVTAESPVLANRMAVSVISLINEFNLKRRQSQAAAERQFTERRLQEVRGDLRSAENRLEAFLARNRGFESPSLQFEQDRLRRDVNLQQQLFATLSQAYEQAKIDEVRDTPVITTIEEPEAGVRPQPRGVVRKTILALIGGAIVGILLAFALDLTRDRGDDGSPEFSEFQTLKRAAVDDLKHPWRPIARMFRRRARAQAPLA